MIPQTKWEKRKAYLIKVGRYGYKIPFDRKTGNLQFCPEKSTRYEPETGRLILNKFSYVWKPNFEFDDELEIIEAKQKSRAIHYILRSTTTNKTYSMFLKDLTKLLKSVIVNHGKVSGTWTFVKKSYCYGIVFIKTR